MGSTFPSRRSVLARFPRQTLAGFPHPGAGGRGWRPGLAGSSAPQPAPPELPVCPSPLRQPWQALESAGPRASSAGADDTRMSPNPRTSSNRPQNTLQTLPEGVFARQGEGVDAEGCSCLSPSSSISQGGACSHSKQSGGGKRELLPSAAAAPSSEGCPEPHSAEGACSAVCRHTPRPAVSQRQLRVEETSASEHFGTTVSSNPPLFTGKIL